jgi:hypothetical protein
MSGTKSLGPMLTALGIDLVAVERSQSVSERR